VVGAIAAVLAWLRLPAATHDVLWAEDGAKFLQSALAHGPIASLLTPYSGYLHTIPRLIASTTVVFVPAQYFAIAMTAASCLVAGLMAAIVYVCCAEVVTWMPARLFIAGLTVMAPLAPREVLGNTANLHSLVLWTLFWIVLYRPRSRRGSIALAMFVLLGALTEIQTVFLLPLLAWRLRDRERWLVRGALVLGVVAQLVTAVVAPRHSDPNPPISALSSAYGYLINSVMPLWAHQAWIGPVVAWGGPLLCMAAAVPLVVVAAYSVRAGTGIQRLIVLYAVGLSMVVWGVSLWTNPRPAWDFLALSAAALETVPLLRYGVLPSMLLLAVVPIAASVAVGRAGGRPALWATFATGVTAAMLIGAFFPVSTVRSHGPAWQPQVTVAREECENRPDNSKMILMETLGWHLTLSCSVLR
jgi:hypothetical protein